MAPEQAYQNSIKNHNFISDPIQEQAVQLTQKLYHKLLSEERNTLSNRHEDNFYSYISHFIHSKLSSANHKPTIKGLYFWGEVGRGKTWIADNLFKALPFVNKRRIHFHPFMQEVHQQLKNLPKTPDPLPIIAKQMAQQSRVLCLDEFHVHDITDAMLLAGLLKALFSEGVILIATSNVSPDNLYKNGLQRDNFLPAIELIKNYLHIFELTNKTDYRTLYLEKEGYYLNALNEKSDDLLLQYFLQTSHYAPVQSQSIEINKRPIQVVAISKMVNKYAQSIIWFEFDELCNTHRSNSDYQFIAQQYSHIIMAHVYPMNEQKNNIAKRFMHLIDALYDHQCSLKISAAVEPEALYHGRRLKIPFQRTVSRLKEMRGILYRGKKS
ncbi:MAG: AFG1 family ATPase [gamma proteobacterium symbiont of Lucinoma myriamae]|nr:AFG1 family ATPase [gamma proteobacterium symbiont of Lucinoma myriamae]MCU7832175.1 AFG1 family ATPase [gamma proteobacterium symbiont of Lucinoma myriamae]